MHPKSPFTQPFDKLPQTLPVFPLDNALLPGGELPLEVFEPRFLNLVRDALKSDQLIGMIQPKTDQPNAALYNVGCAGRIRQYRERKSGRIDVMLTGICRYRIAEEIRTTRGYRLVRADWGDFAADYDTEIVEGKKIGLFNEALHDYFRRNDLRVDWGVLQKLEIEEVVNNLVLILKLTTEEKQLLLEAPTLTQRLDVFRSLIQPAEQMARQ